MSYRIVLDRFDLLMGDSRQCARRETMFNSIQLKHRQDAALTAGSRFVGIPAGIEILNWEDHRT